MNKNIIVVILVALVVGAGAFYGGMTYQQSKTKALFPAGMKEGNFPRGDGQSRRVQGNDQSRTSGGAFLSGEIIAKDDKSLTVKSPDGGSKVVFFSETTMIGKSTEGTAADLENGKQVMINGTMAQDGSFAAQSIQIRPLGQK